MINITNTNTQSDGKIKVSYNGTSPNGDYVSGYYFLEPDKYETMTPAKLRHAAANSSATFKLAMEKSIVDEK